MSFTLKNRALARVLILLALLVAVQGMTAAQDSGSLQFVTWTESSNTFAFDIPYGWTVEAYTIELFGERAPYVYVFEPQQRAVVIAGAPSSVAYLDMDPSLGYTEGEEIVLEGFTFVAGAYQTPAEYLRHYLTTDVLANACDTIFFVQIADAEPTDAESAAAEASLECHMQDGSMSNGYFYLQTMSAPIEEAGQMWMPTDFYGYLSEPAFEAQAERALTQMATSFTINEAATQPDSTVVSNTADTPVNQTTDSGYDPDAFLQAQQELYQQQQTTAMISNMLQMQHETSMAIINNIGGGYDYEYEWVWTP